MRLVWTLPAAADRRAIRAYVAQDSLRAAIALDELLEAKANILTRQPHMGRPGQVVGTRELVVHRNYVLIFDIAADSVRVLRVLHASRRWPA